MGAKRGTRLGRLLTTASWTRTILLRRLAAGLLAAVAVVLAVTSLLQGHERTTPVLVAARDVAPGATLAAEDVRIRELPVGLVPAGAVHEQAAALGRVLAGAARSGEPITDVRLVGVENTRLTTGDPGSAAVPVRLTDPAIADLLRPGSRVDVVSLDPRHESGAVLAADAVVITVRPPTQPVDKGRLVVVALPRESATKVAAASLGQPVTVTLR